MTFFSIRSPELKEYMDVFLYSVKKASKQPKHNIVFICPGKLDNANMLCLVYAAFDTYAVLTETHSADISLSGMAGDQLNHPSTLSSL